MKKTLLITVLALFNTFVFAQPSKNTKCANQASIPKLKGVDSITYDEEIRPLLLKSGWKPIAISEDEKGPLFDKDKPEQYCSATICVSSFKDKNKNKLTLVMNDFIQKVELKCFNQ
ncbi:hypothetical protein [Acinetobacter seifertii]|uniref:hypothetical protein n=1 Tax=Acinetobacter seifertii TaxID=1530123 RepID=UPI0032151298